MQIPKTASSSFSLSLFGPYTRLALALHPSPSYRDQRPRRTADAGPLRTQDQLVDSFPRETILFLICMYMVPASPASLDRVTRAPFASTGNAWEGVLDVGVNFSDVVWIMREGLVMKSWGC